MMLIERPLAALPSANAERFIRTLHAADGRIARTFEHYWSAVQNAATAKLNTRVELARAAGKLLANLADPDVFTVGYPGAEYEPIGMFEYASGIARGVSIDEARATDQVLEAMFLSIARKAQATAHRQLVLVTRDSELVALCRRFGLEVVPESVRSKRLVGTLDLARCENRVRLNELEAALEQPSRKAA
jgi:hypothetical protein